MFQRKITVREVNKYLSAVIDELLVKHGKVSNPGFESELEQITGIHWKQVKNYRNHPQQDLAVSDNAKVKKFVLSQRRKSLLGKLLHRRVWVPVATIVFLVIGVLMIRLWTKNWRAPITKVAESVPAKKQVSIPPEIFKGRIKIYIQKYKMSFQLGPIDPNLAGFQEMVCQPVDSGQIKPDSDKRVCMFSNDANRWNLFQFQITLKNESVISFGLVTDNPKWLNEWRSQVEKQISSPLKYDSRAATFTETWTDGRESVEVTQAAIRVRLTNE